MSTNSKTPDVPHGYEPDSDSAIIAKAVDLWETLKLETIPGLRKMVEDDEEERDQEEEKLLGMQQNPGAMADELDEMVKDIRHLRDIVEMEHENISRCEDVLSELDDILTFVFGRAAGLLNVSFSRYDQIAVAPLGLRQYDYAEWEDRRAYRARRVNELLTASWERGCISHLEFLVEFTPPCVHEYDCDCVDSDYDSEYGTENDSGSDSGSQWESDWESDSESES